MKVLAKGMALAMASFTVGCVTLEPGPIRDIEALTLYERGIQSFHAGQYQSAIKIFTDLVEADPQSAEVWNARGFVFAQLQQWPAVIQDFQEAIKQAPGNFQYQENLAIAYVEGGGPEIAIPIFSRLLNLHEESAKLWNLRGLAFSHLGKYREAIHDFSQALRIDATLASAYANRAVAYVKLGDDSSAKTDLDRSIALDPRLPQAYESRGLLALRQGKIGLAVSDFTNALTLGADNGLLHYNRAIALSMRGDEKESEKEFQLACDRQVFEGCGKTVTWDFEHQVL